MTLNSLNALFTQHSVACPCKRITNLAKFFRNSRQLCISCKNRTSLYKNRKFCKFVTMSNISYKILITFLQKMHFFGKKFLQKMFDQNFKNHQTTSNNSHSCRLQCTNCPRIPAKGFKLLILSKKILHAILPQKLL